MPETKKPFTEAEYERMTLELEALSAKIRSHPEMNHHFAERLALIAKQMRDDSIRLFPHSPVKSKDE